MRPAILSMLALLAFSTLARAEDAKPDAAKPDQAALEKKFEETLTNAALVGTFTMKGKNEGKLNQERYVISSVKKVEGDSWLFMARIQYGKNDATLPLILRVKWAGDTPVITLDNFKVPGFGSFTCRILIFDNQYAGTWSGGDHGGQMFGRIERADAATKTPDATPEKTPEKAPKTAD
jgi:hypothetical protein